MIGLPGDSHEACMESVKKTIGIGPQIARLYPTVIITQTPLYEMYRRGEYIPPTRDELVKTVKDMYLALTNAGINVIRIGLKSSALINGNAESRVAGDTYHPAFRELVEGEIYKEKIETELEKLFPEDTSKPAQLDIHINSACMSQAVGHKGINKEYFGECYPCLKLRFVKDDFVDEGRLIIRQSSF